MQNKKRKKQRKKKRIEGVFFFFATEKLCISKTRKKNDFKPAFSNRAFNSFSIKNNFSDYECDAITTRKKRQRLNLTLLPLTREMETENT